MHEPVAILFGSECHLTTAVLQELMSRELPVSAVVLSGPPDLEIPLRSSPRGRKVQMLNTAAQARTVGEIAASSQVELYRLGRLRSEQSVSLLESLRPDYLLSVCFPRRIPASLINVIDGPAFNIHPSMLPKLRGPDPLFWTFHAGDNRGGVTIHELAETLDAGRIAARRELSIADGVSERNLETQIASAAVDMLTETLETVTSGEYSPSDQHHDQATYAPFPTFADFRLDRQWNARRGFNFVRGVAGRGVPITLDDNGQLARIVSVVEYGENSTPPVDGYQRIEMIDGYLVAQLEGLWD